VEVMGRRPHVDQTHDHESQSQRVRALPDHTDIGRVMPAGWSQSLIWPTAHGPMPKPISV